MIYIGYNEVRYIVPLNNKKEGSVMDAHISKVYSPMTETGFYILLCLRRPNHGYGIAQKVKEMTEGRIELSAGTVYGSLSKMEKDGLIEYLREEQKRKIYCMTPLGREVLEKEIARIDQIHRNMTELRLEFSYRELVSVDAEKMVFMGGEEILFSDYDSIERQICGEEPYFLFISEESDLKLVFDRKGFGAKKKNDRDFIQFQMKLDELGHHSRDLS